MRKADLVKAAMEIVVHVVLEAAVRTRSRSDNIINMRGRMYGRDIQDRSAGSKHADTDTGGLLD